MNYKLFLAAAIALGVAAGGAYSLFQKPFVEVSQSFVVRNERHAAEKVYDYEGYYTLRTANEAAAALIAWLQSPGGVQAVYRDAGIENSLRTLRAYERIFSVKRADTPFFEIRFKAETSEDAGKFSSSLEKLLAQQLTAFQGSASLSLGASPAVSIERAVPLMRNIAYGALLAFALTLFSVLFRKALESEMKHPA